ncbi:MAG: hypothetical protein ABIB97_04845 [Patescibacteria group bacterium]
MRELLVKDLPAMLFLTILVLLIISCSDQEEVPWSFYQEYGLSSVTFIDNCSWNPSWSPSGQQIAFASDMAGDFDLWINRAEAGSEPAIRITSSQDDDLQPAWSPDGEQLAFIRRQSWTDNSPSSIFVCPARTNGGQEARCLLAADSVFQYSDPAYDASGNLYCIADSLYGVGSILLRIRPDGQTDKFQTGLIRVWYPRPAPQGVIISAFAELTFPPTPSIWIFDPDVGSVKPAVLDSFDNWLGAPSPDGRFLAYNTTARGKKEIAVRDLENDQLLLYVPSLGMAIAPAWSPCGRHLCFADQFGGDFQYNVFVYTFASRTGSTRAF